MRTGAISTRCKFCAGRSTCLKASFGAVASSGSVSEAEPQTTISSHPLARVLHPVVVAALQASEPAMYRCTAEVSLERQQKGSGYIAHPAVTDNCMQLGPMTGALEAATSSATPNNTTRVVAGLAAFLARRAHTH